jgi:hypothetical protein
VHRARRFPSDQAGELRYQVNLGGLPPEDQAGTATTTGEEGASEKVV